MADYNLGTASGRIVVNGDPARKGFLIAQKAAESFYGAVQNKVDQVETLGKRLTVAGASGVAAFGVAVNAASKFETGLSAVAAVSGATGEEMDKISKLALKLGADTSFSATEAASAIEELVKAGISVEDVLNGAADATVALAAAGGVSLPEAASIAANAMNQFNLAAKDVPGVADTIAGAANASAIDVGELGTSLAQVGAVANLAGLSFDDTATAIAELGNAGIRGSDAGTSLKTFLQNLIPVTEKQVNEFVKLGLVTTGGQTAMERLAQRGIKPLSNSYADVNAALLEYVVATTGLKPSSAAAQRAVVELGSSTGAIQNQFFDTTGKIKDMASIQGVLAKAYKGVNKEQMLASQGLLFGQDAIRASAVLTDEGADGFKRLSAEMNKVGAADVAKKRLDNLGGSIEELKGSFETMQILIGQKIMPIVKRFVQFLTRLINVFNNLPDGVRNAIVIFFAILTVMSLVAGAAILLVLALVPIIAQFLLFRAARFAASLVYGFVRALLTGASASNAFAAAQARAAAAARRTGLVVRVLIKVLRLLRIAFLFATGPIGLIIIAVAALAALLYKTFPPFRDLVQKVGTAIRDFLLKYINLVKDGAVQLFNVLFRGKFGDGPFSASSPFVKGLFAVRDFMRQVKDGAIQMFNILFKGDFTGGGPLQEDGAFVNGLFTVREAIFKIKDAAIEFAKEFKAALGPAVKTIVKAFREQLLPALKKLASTFVKEMLPALKDLGRSLQRAFQTLKPFLIILAKVAAVVVVGVLFALYKLTIFMLGTVIPAILKIAAVVVPFLIKVLAGLIVGIVKVIAVFVEIVAFLVDVLGPIFRKVFQAIGSLIEIAARVVVRAIEFIVRTFKNLVKIVLGIFDVFAGVFTGDWSRVWNGIKSIFSGIWDQIKNILRLALDVVVEFFKGLPQRIQDAIKTLASKLFEKAKEWGTKAKEGIDDGFQAVIDFFMGLPQTVLDLIGDVASLLFQKGVDFVQGIIDGIKSKFDELKDLVKSVLTLGIAGGESTSDKLKKELEKRQKEQQARNAPPGVPSVDLYDFGSGGLKPSDFNNFKPAPTKPAPPPPKRSNVRVQPSSTDNSVKVGSVVVPAKDIKEMQDVTQFFSRVKQTARARTGS